MQTNIVLSGKNQPNNIKKLLLEKINKLFEEIDTINNDEDLKKKIKDKIETKEIDSEKLTEIKNLIVKSLKDSPDNKLNKVVKKNRKRLFTMP